MLVSARIIRCEVPTTFSTSGVASVTVKNGELSSPTGVSFTYEFPPADLGPAPTITELSQPSVGVGDILTITGTGFDARSADESDETSLEDELGETSLEDELGETSLEVTFGSIGVTYSEPSEEEGRIQTM